MNNTPLVAGSDTPPPQPPPSTSDFESDLSESSADPNFPCGADLDGADPDVPQNVPRGTVNYSGRGTSRRDEAALPPFDTEAEAGALGCLLWIDPDFDPADMLRQLNLSLFYDSRHRQIFAALLHIQAQNHELTIVRLSQYLADQHKLDAVGGMPYLAALPDTTPSPLNFPDFLDRLKDRAARRAALSDSAQLAVAARDVSLPITALAHAARTLLESHAAHRNGDIPLTIRTPAELLGMQFDSSDNYLGDRLLAKGQSLTIVGPGTVGKSRLLLQLAVCSITNRPFLGLDTHNFPNKWLILQAENVNRRIQSDLFALRNWIGDLDWTLVEEQLRIHTLESDADGFLSLDSDLAQRKIADAIHAFQPDHVAWDSLYNFAIGDLNSDADMIATLLAISRLSKTDNPARTCTVLHHALTGKAGAAKALGYDRASFSRNSKALHSWTRGQINVAPGSPDSNEIIVVSCGKCSNGKEFPAFAIRLNTTNPHSDNFMTYSVEQNFDLQAWQDDVSSSKSGHAPSLSNQEIRTLLLPCPLSKAELAKAIQQESGCNRPNSYRYIKRAVTAGTISLNPATGKFQASP